MELTKALVKSWEPCADGYAYYLKHWPDGASYAVVQAQLRADQKTDWSHWLTQKFWAAAIADPAKISALAQAEVNEAVIATKDSRNSASGDYSTAASSGHSSTAASSGYSSKAASSGHSSTAASSGNSSTAASSGDSSKAASSGHSSTAASSGYSSKAASSGHFSTAASSGDSSKAASSGDSSKAASSGDSSTAAAEGENTIAMVAGISGSAKAGQNGCFALCWYDGKRNRIITGYVGEDGVKADTWYSVRDGKLVEA